MRLPTSSEVATLLGAASEDFAPMIALAAFAGLRAGEVAGVQLGDINFLGRTLDVRRQVQREAGAEIEVRAPKYGSERTIYLPDALVTMLATHVARHGLADPTAWLFAYKSGPVTQNVITKRWGTVRAKTTLRNVRFHDLRHHCASGLIASGCDVVAVQRHLGHASATTTLNTYSHLWPTAEDRTRRAAADLMRAATDPPADSPRTQVEKISL
jgi:integrase